VREQLLQLLLLSCRQRLLHQQLLVCTRALRLLLLVLRLRRMHGRGVGSRRHHGGGQPAGWQLMRSRLYRQSRVRPAAAGLSHQAG
jgi:hypothetical protein